MKINNKILVRSVTARSGLYIYYSYYLAGKFICEIAVRTKDGYISNPYNCSPVYDLLKIDWGKALSKT